MENEEKEVGARATTENTGADKATETKIEQKVDYAEMMKTNKEFQSFVDSQKTQAMQTAVANAKAKWEEELQTKKAEADKLAKMDEDQKKSYELEQERTRANKAEIALNAYKLKDETIRQASNKGIPLDLIQTLDFEKETAESINSKLEVFEKTYKAEREKAISEYSKEPPPKTGDKVDSQDNLSGYEKFLKKYEIRKDD